MDFSTTRPVFDEVNFFPLYTHSDVVTYMLLPKAWLGWSLDIIYRMNRCKAFIGDESWVLCNKAEIRRSSTSDTQQSRLHADWRSTQE